MLKLLWSLVDWFTGRQVNFLIKNKQSFRVSADYTFWPTQKMIEYALSLGCYLNKWTFQVYCDQMLWTNHKNWYQKGESKHRISNWPEYNKALVNRGSLICSLLPHLISLLFRIKKTIIRKFHGK